MSGTSDWQSSKRHTAAAAISIRGARRLGQNRGVPPANNTRSAPETTVMHDAHFEANWPLYKRFVAERWPRLQRQEIERVSGDFEELAWLIQLNYGLSKPAADIEVRGWMARVDAGAQDNARPGQSERLTG
jgi:hypothetical protein